MTEPSPARDSLAGVSQARDSLAGVSRGSDRRAEAEACLDRAVRHLLARQDPEGWWRGLLESCWVKVGRDGILVAWGWDGAWDRMEHLLEDVWRRWRGLRRWWWLVVV